MKAQWHFESDPELKAKWKAFFKLLPRAEETRVLNALVRTFLHEVAVQYSPEIKGDKEAQHDPSKVEVGLSGDRKEPDESARVEVVDGDRQDDESGDSGSSDMGKAD